MERKNKKTKQVGNGEGTLYKSETLNCWIFQYYDTSGKRQTMKQRKNESSKDFKVRVTETKNSLNNGTYIEKNNDTFISILEAHIEQKHIDGITSDRSYCRELATINEIKKTCENFINKPIQKISIKDIENSKKNIRKYSNAVISRIWSYIIKAFQIATARRKISYNIMLDETLQKPISERPEKKVKALSLDEEAKFVSILNNEEKEHKFRNILLLQLYTGMRIGECLALSNDCIDFETNTITVYRTLTQDDKYNVIMGEHTKTFKKITGIDTGKRTFPMTKKFLSIIKEVSNSKTININVLLFWDYIGQNYITPSEINNYLRRLNNKYKITSTSLHSHRLRHTFITRCIENNISQKVIQSLVGHTKGSSITIDIYTSVSTEFISKELKKIN